MEIIQILIIIFALFAWSRTVIRFKDKSVSIQELIFWSVVWMFVIVVGVIPETSSVLSKLLGIGRGLDALISLSIVLFFYLVFRSYVKLDQQNQEITKLVREIAKKK